MTHTLRVGVVGCGNIARNHVEAYQALEGVEVVGCCDVDAARAGRLAAEYGIGAAVTTVGDLTALGLDAVSVCTPHPTHEEVVTQAAAAGVHILCEKPIAVDLAAARRILDVCDQAGVMLGVVFQRRFWPAARRIRNAIDSGLLGEPILGQCSILLRRDASYYAADAWRGRWDTDGGGTLMTQGIHFVDLLQWYMGPVTEVSARAAAYKHGAAIEVEDTIVATLGFSTGAMATIEASTALLPSLGSRLRITGSNGASTSLTEFPEGSEGRNDLWAVPGELSSTPAYDDLSRSDLPLAEMNAALIPFHKHQVADFVDALRSRRPPSVTGAEALRSLAVILACYESVRTGGTVHVAGLLEDRGPRGETVSR